jgi:hypothetical protein
VLRSESKKTLPSCAGYGMTEASPLITHTIIGNINYDSVGVPVPNTEMKIVDAETRTDLAQGEMGEICVRGPQVRSESRGSVCIMKSLSFDAFRSSVIDPVAIIGLYCKNNICLCGICTCIERSLCGVTVTSNRMLVRGMKDMIDITDYIFYSSMARNNRPKNRHITKFHSACIHTHVHSVYLGRLSFMPVSCSTKPRNHVCSFLVPWGGLIMSPLGTSATN